MLLDESAAPQDAEPAPPPVRETIARARRTPEPPPQVRAAPPLTTKDPPLWLRHLHWLLVLALIPLAMSLLQTRQEDGAKRFLSTVDQLPPDARLRALQAVEDLEKGKGSVEQLFATLPDHRLIGALLPRDTWAHWLFTLGAAVLFFAFLLALTLEGSATPHHLLVIGLFTATLGILFLLAVQFLAAWSQGVIIIPRGIIGILFWILKHIGYSYPSG